jgi:hypothetical protein
MIADNVEVKYWISMHVHNKVPIFSKATTVRD